MRKLPRLSDRTWVSIDLNTDPRAIVQPRGFGAVLDAEVIFGRALIAVAACSPDGVMGKAGTLPWHYPEDLNYFRQLTLGQVMIMGYKTFLSLPASTLKNRTCFVFTQKHKVDGAIPVNGLKELLQYNLSGTNFVIGGRMIFDLFFNQELIDTALITHIHQRYDGDTYFPLHFIQSWSQEIILKTAEFTIIKHVRPRL